MHAFGEAGSGFGTSLGAAVGATVGAGAASVDETTYFVLVAKVQIKGKLSYVAVFTSVQHGTFQFSFGSIRMKQLSACACDFERVSCSC